MTDTAGTTIAVLAALGAVGSFGERLAQSPAWIAVPLAGAAAAIAGITLRGRYPGTTGVRNEAKQTDAGAVSQVRYARSGREPASARRGRPVAGHRRTRAAR